MVSIPLLVSALTRSVILKGVRNLSALPASPLSKD